ncbi:MAG TPA: cyclic nucleotide-binding domain-containing protein, partial [Alcanivorax sp.]|nr:cyclic nucleotide-binding domain-containing protein [Alcanivorax sp.]
MPVSVPEVLARMRLFDGLNADELAVAEKLVFVNRAAAGDTVCREG